MVIDIIDQGGNEEPEIFYQFNNELQIVNVEGEDRQSIDISEFLGIPGDVPENELEEDRSYFNIFEFFEIPRDELENAIE